MRLILFSLLAHWLLGGCRRTYEVPVAENASSGPRDSGPQQGGPAIGPDGKPVDSSDPSKGAGDQVSDPKEKPEGGNKDAVLFINGWTGEQDEIPAGSAWAVRTVADPAPTQPTQPTQPTGAGAAGAGASVSVSVTYDNRVAQILNGKCVSCHNPNGTRSQSPLESYDRARASGQGIVTRSIDRSMPPAGGTPLDAAELEALKAWQAAGFPK